MDQQHLHDLLHQPRAEFHFFNLQNDSTMSKMLSSTCVYLLESPLR